MYTVHGVIKTISVIEPIDSHLLQIAPMWIPMISLMPPLEMHEISRTQYAVYASVAVSSTSKQKPKRCKIVAKMSVKGDPKTTHEHQSRCYNKHLYSLRRFFIQFFVCLFFASMFTWCQIVRNNRYTAAAYAPFTWQPNINIPMIYTLIRNAIWSLSTQQSNGNLNSLFTVRKISIVTYKLFVVYWISQCSITN